MPDVEIDIDDLLDADSEEERALKLRVSSTQNLEPLMDAWIHLGLLSWLALILPRGDTRAMAACREKAMGCWVFTPTNCISGDKAGLDYSQFLKHLTDMSFSSLNFLGERWFFLSKKDGSFFLLSKDPFAREGSDVPQLYEKERGWARTGVSKLRLLVLQLWIISFMELISR